MAETMDVSLFERLLREAQLMQPLLPTYIHLLASAIFPIFIAAHASLTRPSSAAKKTKKSKKDSEESEQSEEDDPVQKIENLSPTDALLFPVLAGCTLATLYFVLKWLQDPAWLNYILGLYFSQLGLFFAFGFLKDTFTFARSIVFPTTYSLNGTIYRVNSKDRRFVSSNPDAPDRQSPLPGRLSLLPLPAILSNPLWTLRHILHTRKSLSIHLQDIFNLSTNITLFHVLSALLSLILVYIHTFIAKPWPLTNFLGFSFSYGALQYTSPTTMATASLILCALFVYDIYFVFYTPMMVTVATKLDVPIKLLFPRPSMCVYPLGAADGSELMKNYLICKRKGSAMAMLGLGDVVVPGMVIAFALRFDLFLHYLRQQNTKNPSAGNEDTMLEKKPFRNATGGWGERFWTSTSTTTTSSSTSTIVEALKARSFPKAYFYATVIGYLAGLVVTVVIMQVFGHAQPALLYLVPGVLGSFWGLAVVRGEVGVLWGYSEAEEDEDNDKEGKGKDKDGEKDGEKGKIVEGEAGGEVVEGKKEK